MRLFPESPAPETAVWVVMGLMAVLLFFLAAAVSALLIRQKRCRWLLLSLPALALLYFMEQCIGMTLGGYAHTQAAIGIAARFAALPDRLLLSLLLMLTALLSLLLMSIRRHEAERITSMSVKEAIDSLPDGICCYMHGGHVLLANRSMQEFCLRATGEALMDGEVFFARLRSGLLSPGCRTVKVVTVGSDPVTVLPDGRAWKIRMQEIPFERHRVNMLAAFDITETYQKTEKLRAMQQKVAVLSSHLARVNEEIVALTVEQEMLSAKLRLHDELGSNLLAMKRYCLAGGTAQELAEITRQLQRNVSFLKSDPAAGRDEYELLFEIAGRMGLAISVTGALPQTEPQKHIVAVAIHECSTNTLRHAHGDALAIRVTEDAERYITEFSGNGEPAAGEVEEKGGLSSLRALTEKAGGTMEIRTQPSFLVLRNAVAKGTKDSSGTDYDEYTFANIRLQVDKTVQLLTTAPKFCTVSFNTGGGSAVAAQTVVSGQTATRPADPGREGYVFDGWYADGAFSAAFNFAAPVTADITVYARWLSQGGTSAASGGGQNPSSNAGTGSSSSSGSSSSGGGQSTSSGAGAVRSSSAGGVSSGGGQCLPGRRSERGLRDRRGRQLCCGRSAECRCCGRGSGRAGCGFRDGSAGSLTQGRYRRPQGSVAGADSCVPARFRRGDDLRHPAQRLSMDALL